MRRLFASDLHLKPCTANTPSPLNHLLTAHPKLLQGVDEVYLLGDIFDYWVDWSVAEKVYQPHLQALQQLGQQVKLFCMVGNRDFTLSEQEASRLGMTLISDPFQLKLSDQQADIYLTHGDCWVTEGSYKLLSKILRNRLLQRMVRSLSVANKKGFVSWLRRHSKGQKGQYIEHPFCQSQCLRELDADSQFEVVSQATDVIFGHFHRPGCYYLEGRNERFWQLGNLRYQKQTECYTLWVLLQDGTRSLDAPSKPLEFIELSLSK